MLTTCRKITDFDCPYTLPTIKPKILLESQRVRRITILALPIIGAMVSQNILNLVDTAMVSRLNESNAALAAIGFGGFILFFLKRYSLVYLLGYRHLRQDKKGKEEVTLQLIVLIRRW